MILSVQRNLCLSCICLHALFYFLKRLSKVCSHWFYVESICVATVKRFSVDYKKAWLLFKKILGVGHLANLIHKKKIPSKAYSLGPRKCTFNFLGVSNLFKLWPNCRNNITIFIKPISYHLKIYFIVYLMILI
jgi:hypothetical protein